MLRSCHSQRITQTPLISRLVTVFKIYAFHRPTFEGQNNNNQKKNGSVSQECLVANNSFYMNDEGYNHHTIYK